MARPHRLDVHSQGAFAGGQVLLVGTRAGSEASLAEVLGVLSRTGRGTPVFLQLKPPGEQLCSTDADAGDGSHEVCSTLPFGDALSVGQSTGGTPNVVCAVWCRLLCGIASSSRPRCRQRRASGELPPCCKLHADAAWQTTWRSLPSRQRLLACMSCMVCQLATLLRRLWQPAAACRQGACRVKGCGTVCYL